MRVEQSACYLGVDGGLPQASLVAPEDRRDDVQLLLSQLLGAVNHPQKINFLKLTFDNFPRISLEEK